MTLVLGKVQMTAPEDYDLKIIPARVTATGNFYILDSFGQAQVDYEDVSSVLNLGFSLPGDGGGILGVQAGGTGSNLGGTGGSHQVVMQTALGGNFTVGQLGFSDLSGSLSPTQVALTDGHIFVGDATNHPADVAMSGDVTIDDSGVTSVVTATAAVLGKSRPDNLTITIAAGVLSAVATVTGITQLTGDVTAGPGTGSQAATLATVNSSVGSFGSSTSIPSFTVNGKGLITAAAGNAVVAPAGTLTGTTLASNVVGSSLTSLGTIATGVWNGTKIGLAFGGTNADLSATGGSSFVLRQSSSGAAITVSQLATTDLSGLGTGVATALAVNVGTAGAFVVNGGALGTPSSGTLTNATGLPIVGGTTGTLTVARGGTNATSFTAGSVVFAGASGTSLTEQNSTFFWNSGSACLGIGTNNPLSAKLHVSSAADNDLIALVSGVSKGLRIGTNTSGATVEGVDLTGSASFQPLMVGGSLVTFTVSGTERARINSTVFIAGTVGSGSEIILSNSGDPSTGTWIRNDGTNTVFSTNIGDLFFGLNGPAKSLRFFPGGASNQIAIINSTGLSLGIGTVLGKLNVSGTGGQTTAAFNTAGVLADVIVVDSDGVAAGNGGAILFSAASTVWRFATIKGLVINGGNNSQGDISFSTRRVDTDSTLTEAFRVAADGVTFSLNTTLSIGLGPGGNKGQFRMAPNSAGTAYGSMWYNDGSSTYLLLTANNDALGTFNGLRPFSVVNSTGLVGMNNGLLMASSGSVTLKLLNAGGQSLTFYDDTNQHIEATTFLHINSVSSATTRIYGAVEVNGVLTVHNTIPSSDNVYILGQNGVSAWASVASYAYITASDRRLKTDEHDLPDCTDLLNKIRPRRYRLKDGNNKPIHWGFMAQDVGEAMEAAGHDFGGFVRHLESHALEYNQLIPILWKACQEMNVRIKTLEARR